MSATHAPSPSPSTDEDRSFIDWAFRSRETGEIVIAQMPNLPLWIWLATLPFGWFLDASSQIATGAKVIGTAALLWWAVLEIFQGVNPWRRLVGVGGLFFVAMRVMQLLG